MNETKQLRRNNLMDIKEQLVEVRAYLDQELHPLVSPDHWDIYSNLCDMIDNISILLKEQEPRVLTLDEAAAANEVWVEAWLSVPKKYVIMVTSLYLTDDCKNFELELLGTDKKAFMLAEAYGHTWRCWSARPTDEQREAVPWE